MIDREMLRYPLLFSDNRIERFYIGGRLLNEWRRAETAGDSHECEELLVTSIGAISKGKGKDFAVSRTVEEQGGLLLSDIIREYPEEVLGKRFQEYNPNQLTVLARVGDTTVRLVMQCHPRREDARTFFHMPTGKCEAWYIADTREIEGETLCIYAGFRPHVTRKLWKDMVIRQDMKGMLGCLHQIPVKKGQTILIPAGMPHCVGPGCLFLEYHECNDVTIRVEKSINGMTISDEEMFNGLDLEDGLDLFDYTVYTGEEITDAVVMKERVLEKQEEYTVSDLISETDSPAFGIRLITVNGAYDLPEFDGHRIIIPVEQDLVIEAGNRKFTLVQGHAALIPAACKNLRLIGKNCRVTMGIPFIYKEEG